MLFRRADPATHEVAPKEEVGMYAMSLDSQSETHAVARLRHEPRHLDHDRHPRAEGHTP